MSAPRPDESVRDLVRRAHATDVGYGTFDVEAGLAEVLARARAGPASDWRRLAGRDRHAACLVAARAGDRAAFAALVDDLTPLVWHVARGSGLGRVEAEDVVQTVWLALVRNVDRLADPRALAAWLITTTRREANHLRRHAQRARHVQVDDAQTEELASPDPLPEDVVLREDRDRRLWTAFGRLSDRCQELLRLTVVMGRAEYRAVSEELDMPVGSIGPTRGRCLRTLRALYEQEVGEPRP